MTFWRKILSVIGGITAAVTLASELYWPYNKEVGQFIWDYIADPAIIIVIALNVLVNVRDSLRTRSQAGGGHLAQWPRDVVTALVAIVGVRFLMQYADKIAPDHEATSGLWGHLTALAIVILVFEAISLWRSAGRAGQGSPGRPDCSAGAGKETVIAGNDQDHLPG